jgi:type II secretory pathway component PulF
MENATKFSRNGTSAAGNSAGRRSGSAERSNSSATAKNAAVVRVSDLAEASTGDIESKNGFTFSGLDANQQPIKKYYLDVESESDAEKLLQISGIEVESLSPRSFSRRRRGRIKPQDLINFAEDYANQFEAGISHKEILKNLAPLQLNENLSAALENVLNLLSAGGYTLSEAFAAQKDKNNKPLFPMELMSAFRLGEVSGAAEDMESGKKLFVLTLTLRQFAEGVREEKFFRDEFWGAMYYPMGVGILATGAGIFFIYSIIPSFVDLFKGLSGGKDSSLPVTTQLLLTVSEFFQSWWGITLIVGFLGGIVALVRYLRSPSGSLKFAYMVLHLPVFGEYFRALNAAKTARTLSLLSAGGMNVPAQWFKHAAQTATNAAYKDMLLHVETMLIKRGLNYSQAALGYAFLMGDVFPGVLNNIEKTGNFQVQFYTYAKYMSGIAKERLKKILAVLKYGSLAIVFALVGFLVIAFYAPIFEAVSKIR